MDAPSKRTAVNSSPPVWITLSEKGKLASPRSAGTAHPRGCEHGAILATFGAFLLTIVPAGHAPQAASLTQREIDSNLVLRSPDDSPVRPGDEEDAIFNKADVFIVEGKLDEAEALLQERLSRNPNSAGALYRLGRVYFDRHDWARSTDYLVRSLRIEPQNDRAHLVLGLNYFQMDRLDEAERELLVAVKQNPQRDENNYMAGRFYYSKHKRSEALFFFYEAVRLNPENFKALHSVGLCLFNLGKLAMAEHYYRRAMEVAAKKDTQFGQVFLDLADLLTGTQSTKIEEGELFARRAIEMMPDSSHAHYVLGKAHFRQDKFSEAIPPLTKSTQLDPDNSLPHFLLAKIYQMLGRSAEARKEMEIFHSLAIHPRSPMSGPTR